ncbi:response regulator transcription factor [Emcibacter sp. SYSU 3D8]|uniref:response regulator transcription factor n=1 Tax=Emcibacter sp. SYSU 3D8 TaxID=3133969 RepID=UPI0031FF0D0B
MSRKLLVVEDDTITSSYLVQSLREQGYTVDVAEDGREALYLASDGAYELVVLDRMLPGLDGLSVLKALRAARIETPVLLLSALSTLDERVKGLKAGGDDYMVKPFAVSELLARIEVLLRRRSAGPEAETKLRCADLEMDLIARKVTRAGKIIDMQPREFALLEYLMRHQGQLVTRTMLLEAVWDYHFDPQTNVIDVHISRLRQRVDKGFQGSLIHTIRGAGYRLAAEG